MDGGSDDESDSGIAYWRWQLLALGVLAAAAWRAVMLSRGEAEPTLVPGRQLQHRRLSAVRKRGARWADPQVRDH